MRTHRLLPLISAFALAACTVTVPGSPVAGDVEQRGPRGPVPAGLERFYGQALTWSGCGGFAHDDESRDAFAKRDVRCALLTVPLDYANPAGRTATIGVLRKPATSDRVGALVLNPGGPGASGMSAAVGIADREPKIAAHFDVVGFDPRGIGVSKPRIQCVTGPEMDADRAEPDEDTVAEEEAENKDFATKCAQRSGVDLLANVGTRDVARDMDVLRSALGEEKLTYLGYSYGTLIGTVYAEAFPGNVRAMVLDGAVDPDEDPVAQAIEQVKGFDKALSDYFAGCSTRRCTVKSKDQLKKLLVDLEKRPIPVGKRKLSYSDASTGIDAALYSDEYWEFLDKALAELAGGKGESLMLLADLYTGRDDSGEYSGIMDALVAVRCVDEPRITDRAELERRTREVVQATRGVFMADVHPPLPALDTCAFWPTPNTSVPHQPKVAGVPPLLVVSTTGDPATPYQAGVNLAKSLGARLLTYQATQHTAFLDGVSCVDSVGLAYLEKLELPPADVTCKG
ncbi:alpha/beta hydrolase [Actinokineospora sp. NBRC 105648]|uniref:alpha/beta hydrolase n=1 Tax=Actinokineospora sp. NBRC 105648 TaxID=3032206 RepID=UPI002554BE89|nr:alpha/beta hydrolase [Actinokineospora sp. NBRC 105648]